MNHPSKSYQATENYRTNVRIQPENFVHARANARVMIFSAKDAAAHAEIKEMKELLGKLVGHLVNYDDPERFLEPP